MRRHFRRSFGVLESLESRCLLAGNVIATQSGGDLKIEGDDLGNVVAIRQSAPGTFRVFGEDTTINGTDPSSPPVEFSGVTGSVFIRLHGGHDRLVMVQADSPIDIGGALIVEMGDGDDHVQLACQQILSTKEELVIDLGAGHDGLFASHGIRVGTDHVVYGGPGSDAVHVQNMNVQRNMAVHGGAGFDAVRFIVSAVSNSLLIDGGADADLLQLQDIVMYNDSAIFGRDGADLIQTEQLRAYGTFLVNSGADFGFIEIKASGLFRNCYVVGEGPTQGVIDFSRIVRLEIVTGPSGDSLSIERCVIEELFAALGEASDRFAVISSRIEGRARIDAQGGFDVFSERGSVLANVERANFEHLE